MKALVKTKRGVGNIELLDVPEPTPGPGQVKIEVQGCSICGTDIHIYHDRSETRPPVTMGHEFSGIVCELGEGVEHIAVGDRVVSETTVWSCGVCRYCRMGMYDICPSRWGLGRGGDGAFARYLVMRAVMLHKLPANVGFFEGALTEPLACCVHAATEFTHISGGDVVLVTGDGGIGLLTLQVAKACGATVVLCGHHDERLALGRELGADYALNTAREEPRPLIDRLTDGYGVDVVLECAGAAEAANLGLDLVRRRGQYTQVGLAGKPMLVNLDLIAYKELSVAGSFNQQWTSWERALRYLRDGTVKTGPLITAVLPLSRWREGFALYEGRQACKVILTPE
ncbi:MAG: zinc-binding dehydrogenase [Chloroflexi bacterium]|nr:zinc-binding dehydrogenase [Chloroflexota bacterium]